MSGTASDQDTNSPSTILVVDDDPTALLFMSDRLTAEGYSVIVASDGAEALKMIGQRRPNLVLLDIMMPGTSGLEVLPAIKKDHPGLPVAMVTSVWDEKEGKRAFELGAFDYITKPVNIDYLKLAVLSGLVLEEEKSDPNPITLAGENPHTQKTLLGQTIKVTSFPFRVGREDRRGKAQDEKRHPTSVPNNGLYLEDAPPYRLSREHFQIEYRDRQYFVRDRGSSLGLIVNGHPIGGSHAEKVQKLAKGENIIVVGYETSPYRFLITV
jgi:CheY-like chemotaxis protein